MLKATRELKNPKLYATKKFLYLICILFLHYSCAPHALKLKQRLVISFLHVNFGRSLSRCVLVSKNIGNFLNQRLK